MQSRLTIAEKALDDAIAGYDTSLDNLALVQQNIVQEQIKLGKIKSEITNVKDELFATQIELNDAREGLQEQHFPAEIHLLVVLTGQTYNTVKCTVQSTFFEIQHRSVIGNQHS